MQHEFLPRHLVLKLHGPQGSSIFTWCLEKSSGSVSSFLPSWRHGCSYLYLLSACMKRDNKDVFMELAELKLESFIILTSYFRFVSKALLPFPDILK